VVGSHIRRVQRFIEEDRFPLRLYAMVHAGSDAFDAFCERGPYRDPSGRLDVASTKLFADGALGSRGAALLSDYADDPGNRGLLRHTDDELRRHVKAAVEC
jgi:predicted amidohydrolase YtcJ